MTHPTWSDERTINTPDEMHDFGVHLGRALGPGDVVILTGALGAGKTTLTRGIGEGLGVRGPVTSPTFVLARTHPSLTPGGTPLVHVDAYRLAGPAELDDLDLDFDTSAVVIEWGQGMLDDDTERLEIVLTRTVGSAASEMEEIETRAVHMAGFGARWERGITHA